MKWVLSVAAVVAALLGIVAGVGALLPQSHTVSRTSHFHQKPEVIWDVIAGPPTWRPGIKRFENLPLRDGNRTWKEIDNRGNGITYEAIEETPPFRLVTRIADPDLPYGGFWIHEITLEQGGCMLQITEDGEIYNPIYRFMSRFVFGYTATIDQYLQALRAKLGEKGD